MKHILRVFIFSSSSSRRIHCATLETLKEVLKIERKLVISKEVKLRQRVQQSVRARA